MMEQEKVLKILDDVIEAANMATGLGVGNTREGAASAKVMAKVLRHLLMKYGTAVGIQGREMRNEVVSVLLKAKGDEAEFVLSSAAEWVLKNLEHFASTFLAPHGMGIMVVGQKDCDECERKEECRDKGGEKC